ncbi:MAG: D-alanyl-D-alanine carboxypeptidase family protein [Candidatus Caenarcaniphilales bacterium]|nr:D-alanyl-D-alanine carboxypeptidase family protein [Candidatus Caenarcaniphilales bacterium]
MKIFSGMPCKRNIYKDKSIYSSQKSIRKLAITFLVGNFFLCSCSVLSIDSKDKIKEKLPPKKEYSNLFFKTISKRIKSIPNRNEKIKYRILKEYGSLWVNNDTEVILPPSVTFSSAKETNNFHKRLSLVKVAGTECLLQESAAKSLEQAIEEAKSQGLNISPRGDDSCIRSYKKTHELWLSRVLPNLDFYLSKKKLTPAEVEKVKQADMWDQVKLVLSIENEKGLLFDKYRQTSILNSVAAPGTSQHLSGLAFDMAQFSDPQVRKIINKYGWYQTIENDLPHFTYLGKVPNQKFLKNNGLKKVSKSGYDFWVPDFENKQT